MWAVKEDGREAREDGQRRRTMWRWVKDDGRLAVVGLRSILGDGQRTIWQKTMDGGLRRMDGG